MSFIKPLLKESLVAWFLFDALMILTLFYENAGQPLNDNFTTNLVEVLLVTLFFILLTVLSLNFLLDIITRIFIKGRSLKKIVLTNINALKTEKLTLLIVITLFMSFFNLTYSNTKTPPPLNISSISWLIILGIFVITVITAVIVIIIKSIKLNKLLEAK